MDDRIPVAVLGATGTVGQTFLRLLDGHPDFRVVEVAASERSAGKPFREAATWHEGTCPPDVAELEVLGADPDAVRAPVVFSALDSSVAGGVEEAFASAGRVVLTNARNHRMDADVPLVVSEVNADHLALVDAQRRSRGWEGAIVANANCAATVAALALAPLHEAFGVNEVFAATLQAVSGAGYPGVASLDILGNVVPHIRGEEDKIRVEIGKILGRLEDDAVTPAPFPVSVHVNRVPVRHGHTVCLSVGLDRTADPDAAIAAIDAWRGDAVCAGLPSAPERPVIHRSEADRPQPKMDVDAGGGMSVVVGRVRGDARLDLRLVALGHNTVRGAAGGSVLNAEIMARQGLIEAVR